MNSKFLGREYEGFVVIKAYLKNDYMKQYGKDKQPKQHKAYSFILENKKTGLQITISDNQMRLIDKGVRTIRDMFTSPKGGCKNPQILEIKRQILEKEYEEQFLND